MVKLPMSETRPTSHGRGAARGGTPRMTPCHGHTPHTAAAHTHHTTRPLTRQPRACKHCVAQYTCRAGRAHKSRWNTKTRRCRGGGEGAHGADVLRCDPETHGFAPRAGLGQCPYPAWRGIVGAATATKILATQGRAECCRNRRWHAYKAIGNWLATA